MKVEHDDKLEIVLRVGGIPYAKTTAIGTDLDTSRSMEFYSLCQRAYSLTAELIQDIEDYGDEEGIEDTEENPQGHV